MNSHRQPATPYRGPIDNTPAPIREVSAEAIKFPRKKMAILELDSDFLYQVDIVYSAPDGVSIIQISS